MRLFIISLFFILININQGIAQHTFLLLDGNKIETSQYKLIDSLAIYTYENAKGKTKILDKDFVYSITNEQGKSSVVYVPNDLSDNYGVKEMYAFIKGEQNARNNYKPYLAGFGGMAIGLGSSILFQEADINVFYSTFIPLTYSGLSVLFKPKTKNINIPANCQLNDYYTKGYIDKAAKKRFIYTLAGALIGSGIGMAINSYNMNN